VRSAHALFRRDLRYVKPLSLSPYILFLNAHYRDDRSSRSQSWKFHRQHSFVRVELKFHDRARARAVCRRWQVLSLMIIKPVMVLDWRIIIIKTKSMKLYGTSPMVQIHGTSLTRSRARPSAWWRKREAEQREKQRKRTARFSLAVNYWIDGRENATRIK